MKTVLAIIKKELRRFFTDKRTLLALFLPGILIFLIYSLMGIVIKNGVQSMTTYDGPTPTVVVRNEPTEFGQYPLKDILEYKEDNTSTNEELISKVKNKELDIVVIYDEDFYSKMQSYVPTPGVDNPAPKVQIYYNSVSDASGIAYSAYVTFLDTFEFNISNKFDINPNKDISYDLATKEETGSKLLTMVGPLFLTLMIFSGCMSFCSESIAGEKERGTIATLLASPARRTDIAIGKIIPLGIVSLCSSLTLSIGLFASLPNLLSGSSELSISLSFGSIALIALCILTTTLFFTTVLALISTFAKSIKEASAFSLPLMILTMTIAIMNMFSPATSSSVFVYAIPVYNVVQCLTGVFSGTINVLGFVITIISMLVYTFLGIFVISKLFDNEKIMFSK